MLFAKNSDRHPDEPQVVEWHPRRAAGDELRTQYLTVPDVDAAAFWGSRPTWLWGVEHGVNEYRVAIGNEKIWTVDRPRLEPPGLLGMDLVRLGLERARSADAAVDVMTSLLERYGQGGSGEPHHDEPYFSSFLVTDPENAWIVETSDRTWVAQPVGDAAAISNRVSLRAQWTRASSDVAPGADFDDFRLAAMPTAVADHRLTVTRAAAASSTAGVRELAEALRSHGADADLPREIGDDWSGFTVCMHRRESHAQTTASMIVELPADGPLRTWTALGNPCLSVYVPGFPPLVAPELAEPAQWQRFARLRDRVEADPGLLPDARRVLADAEAGLWEAADAAVASSDDSRLAALAARTFAPVDAALRRLGV